MNIIIVEQNSTLRSFYKRLFGYLRVDAEILQSYEEAIALLANGSDQEGYSHLLLEITGVTSSKSALEKLREIDPEIKVIAFCNDPFHSILQDSKEYGFHEVLVKPFKIEDLKKALDVP